MNISKQAIEAGAKANWVYNGFAPEHWNEHHKKDGWLEEAEAMLTAALEHIIPKTCGEHYHCPIFVAAWHVKGKASDEDVVRISRAVLAHLRGEGKQVEASTPPVVKECLTTENNEENEKVESLAAVVYHELQQSVATMPVVVWDGYSKDPNHDLSRACRWIARAATRAMKGESWGVWAIPTDKRATPQREEWYDLTGADRFYTTDKSFCESIVANAAGLGMNTDWFRFEVRPYTAPREETAEEIATASAIYGKLSGTFRNSTLPPETIKELIVDAIRETKRGTAKCG